MQVLKVIAEGLTTSFRYPYFMQGVQPTFRMPPPATIYGHVCSALGEWFDPAGVRFAIHFTYQAEFDDLEHVHVVGAATGRLRGTGLPKVLEGKINPFRRTTLFRPRLVLYLNRPEWAEAFRHPRFVVVLGRSQDLFTYRQVDIIELEEAESAYFEHTLAPYHFARRIAAGQVATMPRLLDLGANRRPLFGRYVVLRRRVHSRDFLRWEGEPPPRFWVDPTAPEVEGDRLGLAFHAWEGEDESLPRLA